MTSLARKRCMALASVADEYARFCESITDGRESASAFRPVTRYCSDVMRL